MRCEAAVTMMTDWVRGELATAADSQLAQHMESCEACREECALLGAVANARPEPPPELEARIQRALRNQNALPSLVDPTNDSTGRTSRPSRLRVSRPGLAAAAVVFLALGTAAVWPQTRARLALPLPNAGVSDELWLDSWSRDVGIVAGAPVLEELTDEQLLTLLEELEG